MTDDDLRTSLGRAAGIPDDRPALDGLWAIGRGRRRRTRTMGAAAAAVAVVVLAVGAVAFVTTGDDDDQSVMAGPGGGEAEEGSPPAEPTDLPIGVEVTAGPVIGGLPTAVPGEMMTVTYLRAAGPGGFGRDGVVTWERWDGATWVAEHALVVEGADDPGSGAVLDLDAVIDSHELRFEDEVDRYPTPDDLASGWYRVCVPMHQYSGLGPTIPGDTVPPHTVVPDLSTTTASTTTTSTATGGPREEPSFGDPIRPCGQLRVPGSDPADEPAADGPTSTTVVADAEISPPPGWGDHLPRDLGEGDEVQAFTAGTPPYAAGETVEVQLARGGGLTLGAGTTWEQWDGTRWVRTHLVEGVTTGGEVGLVQLIAGDLPEVPDTTHVFERDLTDLVVPVPPPAELTSPWSRVCFDAEPSGLGRPCAEVDVDGAGRRTSTTHGDEATWEVDPARPPTIGATSFGALVTRVGCNGGMTGAVLRPQMTPGIDTITFTIDVEHVEGDATCPGNDAVPVTVELDDPLEAGPNGTRAILDGHCRADCGVPPVRWTAS